MGACLRILVPDATTNYVTNPALRYDTTGWNAASSTISRSLDYARFNIASLKVITSGLLNREGAYYRVNALQGISEPITASAYARGNGRVHIRLIDNPAGKEWVGPTVVLNPNRWTRMEVSGYSTGRDDMRLYVETDDKIQAVTFYVDGAQMERKAYATTYCDGDQPGCLWDKLYHASQSSRPYYTREGGKWVEVAGPCRWNDNIYVTLVSGIGMAPVSNYRERYSDVPGSYRTGSKTLSRPLTFTFHVKNQRRVFGRTDSTPLHRLRQELIDIIKPSLIRPATPMVIEYTPDGTGTPLYIKAVYESGLEGEWDIRNQWTNSFGIVFMADDPFLYEDSRDAKSLRINEAISFNRVGGRINGVWSNLNYGFNGDVYEMIVGPSGEIIAVGNFTVANNNVLAIDPMIPANRIAYWDGGKWNQYGSGANGTIYSVAVAPNGDIYVTGDFTNIGGVAANRIAFWNGSVWAALGSGLNGTGRVVRVAPSGRVYVGGSFTTAGGINTQRIAFYNGSWHQMGAYRGFNGDVYAIAILGNGNTVYVGGDFTDQFSSPGTNMVRVASYSVIANTFSALGAGLNGLVRSLSISDSGLILACGDFTQTGTASCNRVASWNASTWVGYGGGPTGSVYRAEVTEFDQFVIVGSFLTADDKICRYLAFWNGGRWVQLDMQPQGALYAIALSISGDLYVGGAVNGASYRGAVTTIENLSTGSAKPTFYIQGPGRLIYIGNLSNDRTLYVNTRILQGEELFIDLDGRRIYSMSRGRIDAMPDAGSDIEHFNLLPGTNDIEILMVDDVGATMGMYWPISHWSADAGVGREPL